MNKMNLKLDKDNGDVLLEGEYSLVVEERTRRSVEQTEYLKFVLIGIVGQFGILMFQFLNSDHSIFDKLDKLTLEIAFLLISATVVVFTTILFLFWLDHALTISAIDKFFKEKEKQNNILGWYTFREHYSKNTFFSILGIKINLMNLKIQLFKFSIFISFLIPPILFILIASLNTALDKYKEIIEIINISIFGIFTFILIFGLITWTYSGKGIYFNAQNSDAKDK